jgi:hypothetical protein
MKICKIKKWEGLRGKCFEPWALPDGDWKIRSVIARPSRRNKFQRYDWEVLRTGDQKLNQTIAGLFKQEP